MMMDSPVPVYYALSADYSRGALRNALKSAFLPVLAARGGATGKSVMIKPNFLEWKGEEKPVCVHPALLLELCRMLHENGASRIAIIENPAVKTAPAIVEAMGIAPELAELGVEVKNCSDYRFVEMPETAVFRKMEVAAEFREFDLVIDFAKAKTHCMMTLTLGVKNLFGLIRGSERLGWHLAVGRNYRRFADMLLDIAQLVRPGITLLDAVTGMEGNGPGSGDPVQLGFIACSSDPLALDLSVAARLGVPEMPLFEAAAQRGILPRTTDRGVLPEPHAVKRPDPPELSLEWGVYFPPKLRRFLRRFLVAKPVVNPARCIGCGRCVSLCPPQSLTLRKGKPHFQLSRCIRCYCCQEHCPCGAIRSSKTFLMKCADRLEALVRKAATLFSR